MLRFIVQQQSESMRMERISIHPMLRFIKPTPRNGDAMMIFQYIPCYGLSYRGGRPAVIISKFQYIPCYGLSRPRDRNNYALREFQYIPCYGLSIEKNLEIEIRTNFNTSHVTVYRIPAVAVKAGFLFQYIPCYGLSRKRILRRE